MKMEIGMVGISDTILGIYRNDQLIMYVNGVYLNESASFVPRYTYVGAHELPKRVAKACLSS